LMLIIFVQAMQEHALEVVEEYDPSKGRRKAKSILKM
jgi:hypothetical protein